MNKNINITLIGAPQTGKTTFVSALLKEETALQLRSIKNLSDNISIYYTLVDPNLCNDISVAHIEFNYDILKNFLFNSKKECSNTIRSFLNFFNFSNLPIFICPYDINKDNDYRKIFEHVSFQDFIENYIHNYEIRKSHLIHHIRFEVPATKEVWNLISNIGLASITFREYIWFDCISQIINSSTMSFTKYCNYLKFNSSHIYIFFNNDTKGLLPEYKQLYYSLLSKCVKSRPTFICKNSDKLTNIISNKLQYTNSIDDLTNLVYHELQEIAMSKEHYTNFNDIQKFCNKQDIDSSIINYYYHNILLPVVNLNNDSNDLVNHQKIYTYSVYCIFKEILISLSEYYTITNFYKNHKRDISTILTHTYMQNFINTTHISHTSSGVIFEVFYKASFSYLIGLANQIKSKNFYGGIVGKRGGFTTSKQKYGKFLLDMTYSLFDYFLNHKMILLSRNEKEFETIADIMKLCSQDNIIAKCYLEENSPIYSYVDKHVSNKTLISPILDKISEYLEVYSDKQLHYKSDGSDKDTLLKNLYAAFYSTFENLLKTNLNKFTNLQNINQMPGFDINTPEGAQLKEALILIGNITFHLIDNFLVLYETASDDYIPSFLTPPE